MLPSVSPSQHYPSPSQLHVLFLILFFVVIVVLTDFLSTVEEPCADTMCLRLGREQSPPVLGHS